MTFVYFSASWNWLFTVSFIILIIRSSYIIATNGKSVPAHPVPLKYFTRVPYTPTWGFRNALASFLKATYRIYWMLRKWCHCVPETSHWSAWIISKLLNCNQLCWHVMTTSSTHATFWISIRVYVASECLSTYAQQTRTLYILWLVVEIISWLISVNCSKIIGMTGSCVGSNLFQH